VTRPVCVVCRSNWASGRTLPLRLSMSDRAGAIHDRMGPEVIDGAAAPSGQRTKRTRRARSVECLIDAQSVDRAIDDGTLPTAVAPGTSRLNAVRHREHLPHTSHPQPPPAPPLPPPTQTPPHPKGGVTPTPKGKKQTSKFYFRRI
jgi:hypothetical protein